MGIENNIESFNERLSSTTAKLIAVSKTQPIQNIEAAYRAGQRIFGENKAQEMAEKYRALPKDIQWHMIGHLQTNKVKYIAPFVALIHSVDSLKLLEEINKQGKKNNRVVPCLLQIHIAAEETKFGFDPIEVNSLVENFPTHLSHVQVVGLIGMATLTNNEDQIRSEFKSLKALFEKIKQKKLPPSILMRELSIGMSSDFNIAVQEGSTFVRIGTAIFGERNKTHG